MEMIEAKNAIEARKAESRERLKMLRVDLADGTAVDPDDVAQIMRDAGIDFEELERQVAVLKSRREMVATIEKCKSKEARVAEIDAEIEVAERAVAAEMQKHQQRVARLRGQRVDLLDTHQMFYAEANLRRGATDPDLQAAKAKISDEKKALAKRQRFLEEQQRRLRDSVRLLQGEIANQRALQGTPDPRLTEKIESHEDKCKGLDPELMQIREAIAGLNVQSDELHKQEMDPNAF